MPSREVSSKKNKVVKNEVEKSNGVNYLQFGESYTSLILGIVVVIIATVLLLAFIHNNNTKKINPEGQNIAMQGTQDGQASASATATPSVPVEVTFTPIPSKPTITPTPKPEKKKEVKVTATPNPTAKQTLTPKPTIAKVVSPVPARKVVQEKKQQKKGARIYTVQTGDSLWTIAENEYKNGYNWVDIKRANNLTNPGMIYKGMKLTLPDVGEKNMMAIQKQQVKQPAVETNKITGTSYVVVRGDNLWTIAVRAYGDGYRWVDIARVNNLTNPSLIHSQNTLKIPRGK